jgi:ribulose bisphosphate carboxylase small subunit
MNTHKEPARGIPVPFRSMYETESEYRIAKETYNKNMELRWKEPTPPSQIEESIKSSFEQGYELGLEHGRELALKDLELLDLEKQLEAINKLTKEDS